MSKIKQSKETPLSRLIFVIVCGTFFAALCIRNYNSTLNQDQLKIFFFLRIASSSLRFFLQLNRFMLLNTTIKNWERNLVGDNIFEKNLFKTYHSRIRNSFPERFVRQLHFLSSSHLLLCGLISTVGIKELWLYRQISTRFLKRKSFI